MATTAASTVAAEVPATTLSTSVRGRRRHISRDRILSILLIVPSAVAIGTFVYGFIGWTALAALTNWNNIARFSVCIPERPCVFPDAADALEKPDDRT